ncbi:MAG: DUF2934 domain-containing protein [Gemmatimonadetes bacterium]|nr:DUF2934 domain-containing protein [Gemmatimonadota bacterium]
MSESRLTNPSTPAKPSRRKRSAKATAPEQASAESQATETATPAARSITVGLAAVDRDAMIATAAYFRAQQRRFEAGHELEDWLAAESEIDAALLTGKLPS